MDPSDFVGVILIVAGVVGVGVQAYAMRAVNRGARPFAQSDEAHRETQKMALRWAMWTDIGLLIAGLCVLYVPPVRDLVNELFG